MNFEVLIRKLAKTSEHQSKFIASKDFNMKLFENEIDLSKLQQIYLSYLYFYHDIFIDIAMKKVSDKVMEDDIYEDSYMLYKREKKEEGKQKQERDIHLVFPRKNKKRNK